MSTKVIQRVSNLLDTIKHLKPGYFADSLLSNLASLYMVSPKDSQNVIYKELPVEWHKRMREILGDNWKYEE